MLILFLFKLGNSLYILGRSGHHFQNSKHEGSVRLCKAIYSPHSICVMFFSNTWGCKSNLDSQNLNQGMNFILTCIIRHNNAEQLGQVTTHSSRYLIKLNLRVNIPMAKLATVGCAFTTQHISVSLESRPIFPELRCSVHVSQTVLPAAGEFGP